MSTISAEPGKTASSARTSTNWRIVVREQMPVIGLFAAICALAVLAISTAGWPFPPSVILQNLGLYPQGLAFVLVIDSTIALIRAKPASPVSFLKQRYISQGARTTLLPRLPLIAILCLFLPLFALLKPLIPHFNPYSWDAVFIAWDQALFGGHDAWVIIQPLLGYPIVTSALAIAYHAWFLLIYPFGLFVLVHPAARHIGREFLFAYLATWIVVGFLLAIAMSSVGPVFLEPIMGDARFAPQMAYLNEAAKSFPVPVLDVQDMLLQQYLTNGPGKGTGISAMPSMHMALCMLSWLAARRIAPALARGLFAFMIVIWIGSVHLAYHYAVDGLVSIIVVAAIWKGSCWTIARWDAFLRQSGADQATLRTNTVPAE